MGHFGTNWDILGQEGATSVTGAGSKVHPAPKAAHNDGRGYLGGAMLFHFLNNLGSAFEKEIVAAVLSVGFVLLAVYVYRRRRAENLSRLDRVGNYLVGNR